MSTRYDPDEKTAVLLQLERNGLDFDLTAVQTGVSARTLRRWHGQIAPRLRQYPPSQAHTAGGMSIPAFENDMDTLKFVRRQIMDELARVAASLNDVPTLTTPYQRSLVLSQLIDKLMKLDAHIKPYTGEMVIRVVRVPKTIDGKRLDEVQPPPSPDDESNGRTP